jgi:HAD superfamily hydrolase (TIGR01509 family)
MPPPTPVAVVFDMDGLMLDTEIIYQHAWTQAGRALGYDYDDAFYVHTCVGRTVESCEAALVERFGRGFPLQAFRRLWQQLWREEVEREGIPLKPGLLDLLAFLDRRRLPYAVATSSDAAYTDFTLAAAGMGERFGCIVTGDQIEHSKPAPDIYLEAARRLGVNPAGCVALEDSEAGVRAAAAAGMRVLLIPDLKPPTDAGRLTATLVLNSLGQAPAVLAAWLDGREVRGASIIPAARTKARPGAAGQRQRRSSRAGR